MPVKNSRSAKKTSAAGKTLVIVESPHKAETIQKFLGSKYVVTATVGHLRDLPKSRMGVTIEDGFKPDYINVRGKADKIKELKALAKDANKIYLATDPDREGEAISWHLCSMLGIDPQEASRIEFNEITKPAVLKAVAEPRPIDMKLVDAQQGRRVIDRLVGYEISPLLWQKLGRGLSAGRVQSAALKLVCDRERQIRSFIPKEYWNITARLSKADSKKKADFSARLEKYNNKKISISNKQECDAIVEALKTGKYTVASIKEKAEQKKPSPPYTTSTLMQDASYRLGFGPEKTRRVAQTLYEGGYITYIRTDSVRISDEADAACRAFISDNYSKSYLGSNTYSNRNKGTQDAHEAIRPSDVNIRPEQLSSKLDPDQAKLYRLVWSRFVASRMKPAVYDTQSVEIDNSAYTFRANSRSLKFDGFLAVYSDSEPEEKPLPPLTEGEELKEVRLDCEQKFTEPPSRYTEASLIKELEDKGIGRPSTYAAIVSNLEDRRYVRKEKKAVAPTALGMKVTEDVMETYFREIVDTGFTASMESDLDNVESGSAEWENVVGSYYNSYVKEQVREARDKLERVEAEVVLTDELCPQCGKRLALKQGRFGEFLACSGFPECRYSRSVVKTTGVKCPGCGGDIVVKRSRKGKVFYGCSNYPECSQVYWYMPVDKKCPKCGSLLVRRGKQLVCSNADCGYREKAEDQSEE